MTSPGHDKGNIRPGTMVRTRMDMAPLTRSMPQPAADKPSGDTPLYERDFHAWTRAQAALLKAGTAERADLDHLAEEIEDMGREQRHAVGSQLRLALIHLLKLRHSPAADPRPGWRAEVRNARAEIADRLADSPSLRPYLPRLFERAWSRARSIAADQMEAYGERTTIPQQCPFTLEQVLDESYWPD